MIFLAFRVAHRPRGRLIESARPEFFRGKRNTIALRPDPIRQTLGRKREKHRECRYDPTSEKKKVEKQREKNGVANGRWEFDGSNRKLREEIDMEN